MALVTTPGAENADSYVTLEEAAAYLEGNAEYAALTDTQKEVLLKRATMQIDGRRFFGEKSDSRQAREFPRYGDTNSEGNLYILPEVKYATLEQAKYLLDGTGAKRAQLQAEGVKSFSLGDLSESFVDGGRSGGSFVLAVEAKAYLKGLISRIGVIVD